MTDDPRYFKVTSKTASAKQLAIAEEMQDLKALTLASSKDVFKLIKAEREIAQFLTISDPRRPYDMERSEFMTFCNEIHTYAQFYLQLAAIEHSTPENGGVFTLHRVLEVYERLADIRELGYQADSKLGRYVWHLNYPSFFWALFDKYPEYERVGEDQLLNPSVVADIFERTSLFTCLETHHCISLNQFKLKERYRSHADKKILQEKYLQLSDEQDDISDFPRSVHDRFAEVAAGHLKMHTEHRLDSASAEVRRFEAVTLYRYKDLYGKARTEGNLDDPHTEKVILRAFVLDRQHHMPIMFQNDPFPVEKLLNYISHIRQRKDADFLNELTEQEIAEVKFRNELGDYLHQNLLKHYHYLRKFFNSFPYL